MKSNKPKQDKMTVEGTANTIRYMVQDMLDDISSGGRIDLDDFEKEVIKLIKNNSEKEK